MCLLPVLLFIATIPQWINCDDTNLSTLDIHELKQLCYNEPDFKYTNASVQANELSEFLKTLPREITRLYIKVQGPSSDNLNLTEIQFLSLESLWLIQQPIDPVAKEAWGIYHKHHMILYDHVTAGPLTIREMHIHANIINTENSLEALVNNCEQLEVLDIHQLGQLNSYKTIPRFLSVLQGKPLKVLRLDQFQSEDKYQDEYNAEFDPNIVLDPLRNTSLECLTLRNNGLVYLKPGLSNVAPRLRIIDLSYNHLRGYVSHAAFLELVLHPKLEVLVAQVEGTFQSTIKTETFRDFHEVGTIVGNNIEYDDSEVEETIQNNFRSKRNVNRKFYQCTSWLGTNTYTVLTNKTVFCEVLSCIHKSLAALPCNVLPDPKVISKHLNFLWSPPFEIPVGQNLREIHLAYWNVPLIGTPDSHVSQVCFAPNNLTELSFTNSPLVAETGYFADVVQFRQVKGMDRLEVLDLSNNNIPIKVSQSQLLHSLRGLKSLKLSGNKINLTSTSSNETLCDYLPQLQHIDLSQGNIGSNIPNNTFSACRKLQHLDLSRNQLSDTGPMANLQSLNLQLLNLSYNTIQMFNMDIWVNLKSLIQTAGNSLTLDLSGNPLVCNCSSASLSLIKMLQTEPYSNIKMANKNNHQCVMGNGSTVHIMDIDIDAMYVSCDQSIPLFIWPVLALIVTALILLLLLYKYRFAACMFYYQLKLKSSLYFKKPDCNYQYDAFIGHCDRDILWVQEKLLKMLEKQYGFKLCVPLRDFPVGISICEAIVSNMDQSRTNIFILTERSLPDEYAIFKLEVALHEYITKAKPLICITMGSEAWKPENSIVRFILDSKMYMEYPKEWDQMNGNYTEKEQIFWQKVILQMCNNHRSSIIKLPGHWCCGLTGVKEYDKLNTEPMDDDTDDELVQSSGNGNSDEKGDLFRVNVYDKVNEEPMDDDADKDPVESSGSDKADDKLLILL